MIIKNVVSLSTGAEGVVPAAADSSVPDSSGEQDVDIEDGDGEPEYFGNYLVDRGPQGGYNSNDSGIITLDSPSSDARADQCMYVLGEKQEDLVGDDGEQQQSWMVQETVTSSSTACGNLYTSTDNAVGIPDPDSLSAQVSNEKEENGDLSFSLDKTGDQSIPQVDEDEDEEDDEVKVVGLYSSTPCSSSTAGQFPSTPLPIILPKIEDDQINHWDEEDSHDGLPNPIPNIAPQIVYEIDVGTVDNVLNDTGYKKLDSSVAAESAPKPGPSQPGRPKCFNCLQDHLVPDCPEPRNQQRINDRRREFLATSSANKSQTRYHGETGLEDRYKDYRPGVISNNLRDALGLRPHQLPLYIYKMRCFGYPPGWLRSAINDPSGLQLHGDSTAHVPNRVSSLNEARLIEYPGFTSPVPRGYVDEGNYFGDPYNPEHSLDNLTQNWRQVYHAQMNFHQAPNFNKRPNYNQSPNYNQVPNFKQRPNFNQAPNFHQRPNYNRPPASNYQYNPPERVLRDPMAAFHHYDQPMVPGVESLNRPNQGSCNEPQINRCPSPADYQWPGPSSSSASMGLEDSENYYQNGRLPSWLQPLSPPPAQRMQGGPTPTMQSFGQSTAHNTANRVPRSSGPKPVRQPHWSQTVIPPAVFENYRDAEAREAKERKEGKVVKPLPSLIPMYGKKRKRSATSRCGSPSLLDGAEDFQVAPLTPPVKDDSNDDDVMILDNESDTQAKKRLKVDVIELTDDEDDNKDDDQMSDSEGPIIVRNPFYKSSAATCSASPSNLPPRATDNSTCSGNREPKQAVQTSEGKNTNNRIELVEMDTDSDDIEDERSNAAKKILNESFTSDSSDFSSSIPTSKTSSSVSLVMTDSSGSIGSPYFVKGKNTDNFVKAISAVSDNEKSLRILQDHVFMDLPPSQNFSRGMPEIPLQEEAVGNTGRLARVLTSIRNRNADGGPPGVNNDGPPGVDDDGPPGVNDDDDCEIIS